MVFGTQLNLFCTRYYDWSWLQYHLKVCDTIHQLGYLFNIVFVENDIWHVSSFVVNPHD
mgnify:CR=1 FL=1